MKNFFTTNWYRIMIASSLFMASAGFFLSSVSHAESYNKVQGYPVSSKIPLNEDGTISVKLSDEQLDKIIPKNSDGSINIMLSEKQIDAITQTAQKVDLIRIDGMPVATKEVKDDNFNKKAALWVKDK